MVTMEEYFPFITKAFDVMQYTAWAVLFLIVVWQLFRAFGGPITEAENPWQLVVRGAIFALLIGYAKPIFMLALDIARAPYTALMDVSMTAEEFTFAGVEQVLSNGLLTIVSTVTVVGPILVLILLIALGWNYFKLLLEAVERYIVVGVLCYTSPLAFCMGGSKATNQVFKSWCRMVGSQLLLLVMNVWFIRGFNSSAGQYIGNGGALSTGQGSIFLWLFCALAFLKTAQKFDSYMAAMGLNVAQTGSSMGIPFLGTTLGSACVFFMKKSLGDLVRRALAGFAAGVMVAASIWSLLIPAIEQSEGMGKLSFLPAFIGSWVGVLFLLLLDRLIPHLHVGSEQAEGPKSKLGRTTMMVLAVTLHNIPEGMAVGVVYAGFLSGNTQITAASALALSLGIAIQNFPEGAIISMPLRAEGERKGRAFLGGVLSGVVEPIGAVLTLLAAQLVIPALPYLLSFAAGAMLYVVVEELIPEMSQGKHSNIGTIFFAVGFSVMMTLDVALG